MAKKKPLNKPDYEALTTVKAVEEEIENTKNTICKKVKQVLQAKEAKKEAVSAFTEEITIMNEEIEHSVAVLDELNARRRAVEKEKASASALRSV